MCSSRVFLRVPCGPIRLCTRSDGSCACESGGTGHGAPPGRRGPARTCCKVNLSLLENSTTVLCMAFSSSSLLEDRSAADTPGSTTAPMPPFSFDLPLPPRPDSPAPRGLRLPGNPDPRPTLMLQMALPGSCLCLKPSRASAVSGDQDGGLTVLWVLQAP